MLYSYSTCYKRFPKTGSIPRFESLVRRSQSPQNVIYSSHKIAFVYRFCLLPVQGYMFRFSQPFVYFFFPLPVATTQFVSGRQGREAFQKESSTYQGVQSSSLARSFHALSVCADKLAIATLSGRVASCVVLFNVLQSVLLGIVPGCQRGAKLLLDVLNCCQLPGVVGSQCRAL